MITIQEIPQQKTGNRLLWKMPDMGSGKYKFLLPAGTTAWDISIQTYKYDQPCVASLALDKDPALFPAVEITDTRKTLSEILKGQVLSAFSPENSGTLMISNTEPSTVHDVIMYRSHMVQYTLCKHCYRRMKGVDV